MDPFFGWPLMQPNLWQQWQPNQLPCGCGLVPNLFPGMLMSGGQSGHGSNVTPAAHREASPVRERTPRRMTRPPSPPFPSSPPSPDDRGLGSAPDTFSQNDDPVTPEVIRRLLAVTSEGGSELTTEQAVARLEELSQQAKARLLARSAQGQPPGHAVLDDRRQPGPYFKPSEVAAAKEAITAFQAALGEITKKQTGASVAVMQINVKFTEPVPSAAILVDKVAALHGAKGPPINVQPLDGSLWRKPTQSVWYAEKKGDSRTCVYRVNIPPEGSQKKPRNLSFQVSVAGKELTVKGVKGVLQQFGPNIVMQFGPHRSMEAAKVASSSFDLSDFWGR